MCGIAGFETGAWPADERAGPPAGARLRAMVASLVHRGPDAQRGTLLGGVALGHARLSIVDIGGGLQPMRDPETGTCVVLNGEIFNHSELRQELCRYRFRTRSDTEVVLAAYRRWGVDCVQRFIGQWAFALWDPFTRELHLSRDRLGVRPLFYTRTPRGVAFASEIKALFAGGFAAQAFDPAGVKEATCLWSTVPPRTSFAGVLQLPPGCSAVVRDGSVAVRRYWHLDLGDERIDPELSIERAIPAVSELLDDAVRLRLRADVPVAAYLSGGLDSSLTCALALRRVGRPAALSTFSLAFEQMEYDERQHQRRVSRSLATTHHELVIGTSATGELLPDTVRLAEQPLVRSAPAPMLALSRLVRDNGMKVVLTGEGADEIFWGYQLYQEAKIRASWASHPQSRWRHLPLRRIYPYLGLDAQRTELLRNFYAIGLETPDHPAFSHLLRWTSTARAWRFFSPEFSEQVRAHDPMAAVLETVPKDFARWRLLARAQFLEVATLLSGYLLSAQGDRMLMGGSVEGRFPFLDHRLVELAARLPDEVKLRFLSGKRVLRRIAGALLPDEIVRRPKVPYRAPIAETIAGAGRPAWAREALSREAIDRVAVFDATKVEALTRKLATPTTVRSESDNMALMAVASVQLLDRLIIHAEPPARRVRDEVQIVPPQDCDAGCQWAASSSISA